MSGFNTTFVTVLLYSGIYGASDCSVSIQLLLLFYGNRFWNSRVMEAFQYNFCYCSIYNRIMEIALSMLFQYNFCYCTIVKAQKTPIMVLWFQYNFCYCSIALFAFLPAFTVVFQYNFCYCSIRIFTGFLFYYITRYPLKIKIF